MRPKIAGRLKIFCKRREDVARAFSLRISLIAADGASGSALKKRPIHVFHFVHRLYLELVVFPVEPFQVSLRDEDGIHA